LVLLDIAFEQSTAMAPVLEWGNLRPQLAGSSGDGSAQAAKRNMPLVSLTRAQV